VKVGDVIIYKRSLRKTDEDPEVYAFAGIILSVQQDIKGNAYTIFWSDYMNSDELVPCEVIENHYEVIHETW